MKWEDVCVGNPQEGSQGWPVVLTPMEVWLGVIIGVRQRITSLCNGYKDRHGLDQKKVFDAWMHNFTGAFGEIAFCKTMGLPWNCGPTRRQSKKVPDVPPNWQVRCRSQHNWDLLVREDDRDQFKFALITGLVPNFFYHGWMWGGACKRPEWKHPYGNREEAYFVPQGELTI